MNSQSAFALSRAAFILMLDSMIRGMIVLLLVGIAVRFARRLRASARQQLWLLALVMTGLMPLLIILPGWRVLPSTTSTVPVGDPAQGNVEIERSEIVPATIHAPSVAMHESSPAIAVNRPVGPTLIFLAIIAWATGAAVMGGRLLLSRFALRRLASKSKFAPESLHAIARLASARLSLRQRVRLLQATDPALMPMTWGLFPATVLLPLSASEWPEQRRRVVILHELAHAKRLDYLWISLVELIGAVYWFNPLWRWALNRLRDEAEQACDEAVLAAGEDRCTYANELVATVKGQLRRRRTTPLALAMSRTSSLEARVSAILSAQNGAATRGRRVVLPVLLLLLVAAPLSQIRLEAQSKPATAQTIAPLSLATRGAEVTYGGTLQDAAGKPIANATLRTGWTVPNRLGEFPKMSKTDPNGVWTVSADPAWTLQHIMGAEPGYVRLLVTKPDRELLASRKLSLTMQRSVSMTGYIRDEGGQPIVGALITPPLIWNSVSRTRGEDPSRIYSGADGKFKIDGLSPTNTQLYISAEAFAPAVVTPKNPDRPVIEMLSKGGDVPGIVLDQHKKPLADTTVTLSDWHYKGLHRFTRTATTDQSGRFVIRHVPLEGDLWLQASGPGLLSVRYRVTAGENPPYEVQIVRPAKAHVEVVDDETGRPVTSFQYSVSEPIAGSDAIRFADFLHTTIESKDGKFEVEPKTRNIYSPDQQFRIRVTADNYMPQDSPVFKVNGESFFTIRLKPAKYISGSVLNADGTPAANAQVAWVRPERHMFVSVDGLLDTQFTDSPDSTVKCDAAGHFSGLKVTSEAGNVAVISPDGFAALQGEAFSGTLTLKPWASLTGKYLRQDKPMIGQQLLVRSSEPQSVFWADMTTSVGIDGSFYFRRLPAGVAKLMTSYDGHDINETIDLKSGQTARHEFFRND